MWCDVLAGQRRARRGSGGGVDGHALGERIRARRATADGREQRIRVNAAGFGDPVAQDRDGGCGERSDAVLASLAVLCRALVYAEQRFGELEMPCQVRESGLGDVGQLGIILVADRGFLHAGPWVSGEGGDDDESVRGRGEWLASAVQARF